MSTKQRQTRNLRLANQSVRGDGLRHFLEHHEVQEFFKRFEAECVERIAQCEANDDDERRDAGLKLTAMRSLHREMREIVNQGDRAKSKLENLENE